jgi:hypothetical protein
LLSAFYFLAYGLLVGRRQINKRFNLNNVFDLSPKKKMKNLIINSSFHCFALVVLLSTMSWSLFIGSNRVLARTPAQENFSTVNDKWILTNKKIITISGSIELRNARETLILGKGDNISCISA